MDEGEIKRSKTPQQRCRTQDTAGQKNAERGKGKDAERKQQKGDSTAGKWQQPPMDGRRIDANIWAGNAMSSKKETEEPGKKEQAKGVP